jgi:hypothetical protein
MTIIVFFNYCNKYQVYVRAALFHAHFGGMFSWTLSYRKWARSFCQCVTKLLSLCAVSSPFGFLLFGTEGCCTQICIFCSIECVHLYCKECLVLSVQSLHSSSDCSCQLSKIWIQIIIYVPICSKITKCFFI